VAWKYDSALKDKGLRKEKTWGNENPEPGEAPKKGPDVEISISKDLVKGKEQLGRIGNDDNNIRFGALDYGATVAGKYDPKKGEVSGNFSANARVTAVEGNLSGTIGDEKNGAYGKGEAQGRVLTAGANVDASVTVGKTGVNAKVEGGAEANLVEGKVGGEVGFRIPGLGWKVSLGGEASGQVGAGIKGNLTAQANSKGIKFSAGAKGTLGLGAGFKLNIGISFD
jgi:hypothetical protein